MKGLYMRQRVGAVSDVTGMDDPYEPPLDPDVLLPTHELSLDACVARLWEASGLPSDKAAGRQVARLGD